LAKKDTPRIISPDPVLDTEDVKRRFDMVDQRLDNIDSIVSAVVERVMSQPLTINITCPHCGGNVEIALIGSKKPSK